MIPLAARSHFSLMWGTTPVDRLCRGARALGYGTLALTDTNNLHGLWTFLHACERHEITPIVGAALEDRKGRRAACLVKSAQGYRNLCRLLTRRHLDADFALGAAASRLHRGLVLLTDQPALLRAWRDAEVDVAAAAPRRLSAASATLRRDARRLDLPLVATPDSVFLDPGEHHLHQILRAVDQRTSLSRLDPEQVAPADAWLAPAAVYRRRFHQAPEAVAATHAVAERCAFTGPSRQIVMPPWRDDRGRSAAQVLRDAAYRGARRRYGDDLSEVVVERLEHELALIERKEFSAYFLVVQQIIRRSPRICGRGSGAASLVAYSLGVTNVCPLKHNLYFERFLNPGRIDPPDIDVDFAWDERDDVLRWVLEQHEGHAAMVCNHVLFQPRMAVREVARVFGLPDREISRVMSRLPLSWGDRHFSAGGHPPGPSPAQAKLTAPDDVGEPWPTILSLASRLVGTPRHLSVHPGGMVITPGPINEYVPVERAPKGVPIIQWEKDGTEESGLVKIDLLGNRSLAVIRDALAALEPGESPLAEDRWEPEDDLATQRAVATGRTMGCFYIESPAMRLLQQRTAVGDFEHLVIHSSIIRPAANMYIREYIRRLRGGAWEPIHPLLADVLQETLGIMVYQEDVSRTAVALAGFSHAEADGLRKILTRKDRERWLGDFRQRFTDGARARGITKKQIDEIWDMMMSFEGYSFCKPHSASYARVSFQAAYLKVHHSAEFMAAVISNRGGFYSTFAYVSEARRLGLAILPPDVNRSQVRWQGWTEPGAGAWVDAPREARRGSLRAGLMAVKGLSEETQTRMIAGRPYRCLESFLDGGRPGADEARALIRAGACDALAPGEDRASLLWQLLRWQRRQTPTRRRGPRCGELFPDERRVTAPALPAGDERDSLRRQFEVLGFLCDRHPMTLYRRELARQGVIVVRDLRRHVGRRVPVAGWLVTGKVVPTRRGEPMEFLTFEDETGLMETTFFPRAYRRFNSLLDWNRPFQLTGKVEEEFGAVTLTVDQVRRLGPIPELGPRQRRQPEKPRRPEPRRRPQPRR